MVRATGIEPVSQAWEARILPLNYARSGGRVDSVPGARRQLENRAKKRPHDPRQKGEKNLAAAAFELLAACRFSAGIA